MNEKIKQEVKGVKNKKILRNVTYLFLIVTPFSLLISLEALIICVSIVLVTLFTLSFILDASLPNIGKLLERRFYQNNFNLAYTHNKDNSIINTIKHLYYQVEERVLYYLIVLSKSSKGSFRINREKIYFMFKESGKKGNLDEPRYLFAKDMIEKLKKKEEVSLEQLEELETILYDFYKSINTKIKVFSISGLGIVMTIALMISSFVFQNVSDINAATYGWVQTDWAGGDTGLTANHDNHQTSWDQYATTTGNMDTSGGELKQINPAPDTWTETDDADFSDNGVGNVYIANGNIQLKKPDGASCTSANECISPDCISNICGPWQHGPCSGILVYKSDSSISYWDDGVTRCEAIGGRLPSLTELTCIHNNSVSYGNNFGTPSYWSSEEPTPTTAIFFNFTSDLSGEASKSLFPLGIRCVKNN